MRSPPPAPGDRGAGTLIASPARMKGVGSTVRVIPTR